MASDAGKMDRGPVSFIVLKRVETLCVYVCVLLVFLVILNFPIYYYINAIFKNI